MNNNPSRIVLSAPASAAFRQEIEAALGGGWQHRLTGWMRPLAFLAAFIVLPGVLGYLRLTSDRFNVGLMVGGGLAMVLDGWLMVPKNRQRNKFRFFDQGDRVLTEGRIGFEHGGHRFDVGLAAKHRLAELPGGLFLRFGKRGVFPIEYAGLPRGTDRDLIRSLVKAAAA